MTMRLVKFEIYPITVIENDKKCPHFYVLVLYLKINISLALLLGHT